MEGCVQWNTVYGCVVLSRARNLGPPDQKVMQRLTHWAIGAPLPKEADGKVNSIDPNQTALLKEQSDLDLCCFLRPIYPNT